MVTGRKLEFLGTLLGILALGTMFGGCKISSSDSSDGGESGSNWSEAGAGSSSKGGQSAKSSSSGGASSAGLGGSSYGGSSVARGGSSNNSGGSSASSAKKLTWSESTLVETSDETASAPRLAVDPNGTVMAVWVQSDGAASSIYASRRTSGGDFGTATLLEQSDMPADSPQVVADGQGNFLVAWRQAWNTTNGTEYGIYASRFVSGTGWGNVETVHVNMDSESVSANGDIQLAATEEGDAVLVFSVYDWGWNHNSVRAARYAAGTGWGDTANLSTELVQTAAGPDVALDPSGNAFVVWEQAKDMNDSLQGVHAMGLEGTSWGQSKVIETGAASETRSGSGPQVAFDSNGNALVVWYQYGRAGIYANRWTAADGWGTQVAIADVGDTSYDEGVRLATDSRGNAMAVWNQKDGKLYANRYVAEKGWSTTEIADPGGADSAAQVAFYPNGNALAVWAQYSANSYDIWSNTYVVGTGWGTPARETSVVNRTPDYASEPQLVIDQEGRATVVWVQNKSIYAATAEAP